MSESENIIIVAEDSAPNRAILVHLLKKMQFDVLEYEDGEAAWEATSKMAAEGKVPSAILSDIMMPKMDGLQYLEKVRTDEKLSKTPFVLVSAISDKDHVVKAKSLNVNGYIVKPVSFQRVLAKLKELFPKRKFPEAA